MLNIKTRLDLKDPKVRTSPNLTSRFPADDLASLGNWVWEGFDQDLASRADWAKRTEVAMNLALQVSKEKSFPWPNCANVAFPLVTIAALQFHSRAYPALVSAPEVVQCRVVGDDPSGEQAARAYRIGCHMSYQLLEEDESWEEQHDRTLISVPIVGCAFKKSYFSSSKGHNVSELVLARDLVLDYYAKSVDDCARKTHIIPLYRNDLHERMIGGVFRDCTGEAWFKQDARPLVLEGGEERDKRDGLEAPRSDESTPFTTLEQHCWIDLDGDGYAEPYVITVEAETHCVLRIVARWEREEDIARTAGGKVLRISAMEYFTKYGLIPSPDGGIYDVGFGMLLGPLNESTNTLVNQLIDAGTWATTAGGFLGRGAKIRGGTYSFSPLEWARVDSTGDDLRKNIVPHTVREPSAVLFNLLSLLINYTERISGSTDMMVGENPGQNTPAETSRAMIEQGSKIYTAIFKRMWRCMKQEFKKLYTLNALYLPPRTRFGASGYAMREDYLGDPRTIAPAADPNITSDTMRIAKARAVKEAAMTTHGYNPVAVEQFYLKSLRVDGVEALYPGPEKMGPPGKDIKLQIQELKTQVEMAKLQETKQQFVITMMEEHSVNQATILELQAKANLYLDQAAESEMGKEVALLNAMVGAAKARNDHLRDQIELMLKKEEIDVAKKEAKSAPAK